MNAHQNAATVVLCLLGAGLLGASLYLSRDQVNGTDFLALYSGARLAGTGHMYDPQAVWNIQTAAIGKYGPSLLFTRMPCFGLLLWPLAQMPYTTAKALWISLQLAAIVCAVWLWPGSRRVAAVVVCWSLPALACLANGADTALLFFWLVLWWRLEREDRPFAAGLALAFCIAKFHLFLFMPFLLLRHRRWRVVQGAALGVASLLVLSYAAGGWHWPADYIRVLSMPGINPGRLVMPNIHGLVPPAAEIPATLLVVVLTCAAIVRLDYGAGLAAALTGSLLCSYHAYVMDGVVLLPALILMVERYRLRWPSYIAGFVSSPIPWVALLLRKP